MVSHTLRLLVLPPLLFMQRPPTTSTLLEPPTKSTAQPCLLSACTTSKRAGCKSGAKTSVQLANLQSAHGSPGATTLRTHARLRLPACRNERAVWQVGEYVRTTWRGSAVQCKPPHVLAWWVHPISRWRPRRPLRPLQSVRHSVQSARLPPCPSWQACSHSKSLKVLGNIAGRPF